MTCEDGLLGRNILYSCPISALLHSWILRVGLVSASVQIIDGTHSTVWIHPDFVLSYSLPITSPLKWACPEQLWLRSIVCRLVLCIFTRPCTMESCSFIELQVRRHWTNRRRHLDIVPHSLCIGHDIECVVRWFLTKPNANSTPSLPASDPGSTAARGSKSIKPRPSPICV